mmetsp:Transcript_45824/g.62400  ORF Transcript_45824/g.62400 Transcript_45824/m.62400 type:complete len:540 (-) Transcript_45824:277-1896(-)|eukprot:CAMPEP_0185762452 /NCGR_PEP_ID=MMETSP1174-20130828/21417_1 /TAXON_ID=35687 /ORGANISM="Dictyocha speculum, Strain CCMP1381" /LENGTH=539 /DNA_ID=CAMNT_0028444135 /DNA_START=216 /DNA_END=1835 /DNA_ORIENTATION=-
MSAILSAAKLQGMHRAVRRNFTRYLSTAPNQPYFTPRNTLVATSPFPSLFIRADGTSANGVFAESQLVYLEPDEDDVAALDDALAKANMGVVAHFYMDVELQGILSSLKSPHVSVADSLAMGDAAVGMVNAGATSIACLGVDFMSESVRATMDALGASSVPLYRMRPDHIGCSLAESAEGAAYSAWLSQAEQDENALHVVYINTSLKTKAEAQARVPTITCTSSNVVQTILQASAQVPDVTVYYGPDTYMGENLRTLFQHAATLSDEEIKSTLHPGHDQASIRRLLERLHVFQQGNCVVHHMFGSDVVQTLKDSYSETAFFTAHLEVPGEMFQLALPAAAEGRGVVGSTSNILNFIVAKTKTALASADSQKKLQFVLGTEAGMVTPIVRAVQSLLRNAGEAGRSVEVEIVFPVAAEAVAVTGESADSGLAVVPGVQGGEGCSTAGGCATCPFMKMNTLETLMDVAAVAHDPVNNAEMLKGLLPPKRHLSIAGEAGRDMSELGSVPIHHMRHLMHNGSLSDDLVADIESRGRSYLLKRAV